MKRGALTFVFDDGYTHILKNVVPLLEHHNMRSVFAIPIDAAAVSRIEKMPVSPVDDWLLLKNRGHEIAAHSINHVDLTTLDDTELDRQLREPQRELNATTLVYPGGAHDDRVIQAAQKYYRTARTVIRGFESLPPRNPMQLKTINWTRHNFSVTRANTLALWAWLTNSWLIETYHIVADDQESATHSVDLQSFKKHVGFVSRLPIKVDTIEAMINKRGNKDRDPD